MLVVLLFRLVSLFMPQNAEQTGFLKELVGIIG
jgi:hypothetical protein